MTVNNSDVMHRRTDGPSHWGSISLAREELLSAGKTLCGRELDASALACLVRPNPDQMTRLRYLHLQLGRAICFPPRILDAKSPRIVRDALPESIKKILADAVALQKQAKGLGKK